MLARGTSRIVDGFFSPERCYLLLTLRTDRRPAPIDERRLEVLEAVLGGVRQKSIAIDLARAPSTIAMNCKLALANMGVDCKPSRAHPLLMLAARAMSAPTMTLARCSSFVGHDDLELRVISIPRPDRCLAKLLPYAELEVVYHLVEGLPYREIARRRKTSTRTIANQVCAVFRRLGVSGRNELVQKLLFDLAAEQHAPSAACETLTPPNLLDSKAVAQLGGARRSA